MRGLCVCEPPPKKVEGDEPPWNEEMGLPVAFTSLSLKAPDTQTFRESGPKQKVPTMCEVRRGVYRYIGSNRCGQ